MWVRTLCGKLEGFGARQAQHDAAVGHGLEKQRNERRPRSSERRRDVKVLFIEEAAHADRG